MKKFKWLKSRGFVCFRGCLPQNFSLAEGMGLRLFSLTSSVVCGASMRWFNALSGLTASSKSLGYFATWIRGPWWCLGRHKNSLLSPCVVYLYHSWTSIIGLVNKTKIGNQTDITSATNRLLISYLNEMIIR